MDKRASERQRPGASVIAASAISQPLLRSAPGRSSRTPTPPVERPAQRKSSAAAAAPSANVSALRDSSADLSGVIPPKMGIAGPPSTAKQAPGIVASPVQPPPVNNPTPNNAAAPTTSASRDEIGDDVLVHQAQAGSATAFKLLIERHQRAVFGYFRARVLEASDAEDLCQEVFLRCYQMPATFESPIMVRPWLMGISRNVLREHIRRLSRRKEVAWTELCMEVDASSPATDDRYDDIIRVLPSCLESLGSSAREALEMYYRSKLRLAQIGERLRRSEGAVKLLMYRARQSLKNCLLRKTGCPVAETPPGE